MDLLSIFGLILAFFAVGFGQYLEGGEWGALLNAPAFLIVVGGTLGAVVLQTPAHVLQRGFSLFSWIFKPPNQDFSQGTEEIFLWHQAVRKDGVLALEKFQESHHDPFVKKGLELLLVGTPAIVIRSTLEMEIENKENQDMQGAMVFESMGGYAPTIGILGAVLGLIHVMGSLADPSQLGSGIAVAFVATIYGVGFANLVFLPIANKLKYHILLESRYREMIIEGLVSLVEADNLSVLEAKLSSYFKPDSVAFHET